MTAEIQRLEIKRTVGEHNPRVRVTIEGFVDQVTFKLLRESFFKKHPMTSVITENEESFKVELSRS